MRLLEVKGPGEFSLIQVATHNTLPYAILSHTWTDQEVTYQDLSSDARKRKSGYEKITFCGEQAAKDDLRYFWVDTCCIDKSDPAELSKAINSMFRWYRNAKKCYVYLADVSTPGDEADQSGWEAAFRKSRWFTRGWTLQELIAPVIVEFYSKEGRQLGNKRSLETLIHEITRIPFKALQGNPISDFSIAERKEWAAQRHTTEQEDIVYCLIGLCEVSMPLLYGEGKEAAQKRLETAVKEFTQSNGIFSGMRSNLNLIFVSALLIAIISYLCLYALGPSAFMDLSTQHSSEAMRNLTTSNGGAPFIVPFDRNPTFTGREPQLANLEEKLFEQGQTAKLAIIELGGIGKTQLVLELVYRIRDKHKNCSIIWIPATNIESLHQSYLDVARQLKIPGFDEDKANAKKLVQTYLSKESTGRWLLVFDNADDVDMWTAKPGTDLGSSRLIDYLPRNEQGCIIFTMRDRKTAVKLAHQNVIEVPEMDEEIAIQLLQKCLINQDLVKSKSDATALLKELTYLPLAIVQAAAYINENGITFADYISLLADQEEAVIDLLSEEFEDGGRYNNIKNPVATTWLISFEQIRHRDPLAADYLSFIACIEPKDIPQSLLPAGATRKKEIDAIGTLESYSFIIKRAADQALDLHRLVHLATRSWLRKQEMMVHWTEMAITRLEEIFPDDDYQSRSMWRIYLPHVQYALESALESEVTKVVESRSKLAWRFGMCLLQDGRYKEAERQFLEAFETDKGVLGQEHPDTLTSMANLASTYRNQGRWKEAEDLEVQVIETRKRVLGQEHLDTLTSIANLASTFWKQGRWKEAEDLNIQVIETRKRVLGQEHPDTLTSMANLASIYSDQGRWKEAEDLEVLVMETSLRVLGREHPDTLISMGNLALTYWNQGRWKEAEDLEVVVMETNLWVLGQEHPNTLISMVNLASTYRNHGLWKEAEDLEVLVMETSLRVLGQEHPDTLTSMANLALTYRNQGRWKEAEDLEVQVMETSLRVLGQEHPDTLTSIANLASTYQSQGRWKEAEDLEVQVIETRKRVLGQEHPDMLISIGNLALTYRKQGRWKEAEDLEVQVMETSLRVLGQEHPDTLTSMANLASTYQSQGRWKDAEDLDMQVMETSLRVLGQEHPFTLTSIANLASTYRNQDWLDLAEKLEVKVMETRKMKLGVENLDTLNSMANLAFTWKGQGRYEEALKLMEECITLRAKIIGPNHPDTLSSYSILLEWQTEHLGSGVSANKGLGL